MPGPVLITWAWANTSADGPWIPAGNARAPRAVPVPPLHDTRSLSILPAGARSGPIERRANCHRKILLLLQISSDSVPRPHVRRHQAWLNPPATIDLPQTLFASTAPPGRDEEALSWQDAKPNLQPTPSIQQGCSPPRKRRPHPPPA